MEQTFLNVLYNIAGPNKRLFINLNNQDEILKAYRLFVGDETGKISFKNLKRVAKELGERMTAA